MGNSYVIVLLALVAGSLSYLCLHHYGGQFQKWWFDFSGFSHEGCNKFHLWWVTGKTYTSLTRPWPAAIATPLVSLSLSLSSHFRDPNLFSILVIYRTMRYLCACVSPLLRGRFHWWLGEFIFLAYFCLTKLRKIQ